VVDEVQQTYIVQVRPHDDGHVLTVVSLPRCVIRGRSVEDCLARAPEAIALHVASTSLEGSALETPEPPRLLRVMVPEA
jgi:predicted RNase H-like HicB family nuclease